MELENLKKGWKEMEARIDQLEGELNFKIRPEIGWQVLVDNYACYARSFRGGRRFLRKLTDSDRRYHAENTNGQFRTGRCT